MRAALSTAVELYQAMDMTFWIPQAQAGVGLWGRRAIVGMQEASQFPNEYLAV
jgi:hypothetical protein